MEVKKDVSGFKRDTNRFQKPPFQIESVLMLCTARKATAEEQFHMAVGCFILTPAGTQRLCPGRGQRHRGLPLAANGSLALALA